MGDGDKTTDKHTVAARVAGLGSAIDEVDTKDDIAE